MTEAEMIEAIEETAGEIGGAVRASYSGRYMWGAVCYGIVCDSATDCIEEAASRGLRGAQCDSMGKSFIVYWPSVKGKPWKPEP